MGYMYVKWDYPTRGKMANVQKMRLIPTHKRFNF